MHNEAVAVFVLMNLVTAIIAPGQRRKKQSCHEEETELFWTTGTDTSPVQLTTRRERERERELYCTQSFCVQCISGLKQAIEEEGFTANANDDLYALDFISTGLRFLS